MPEYRHAHHRRVARILEVLNPALLDQCHCYFGGGTRIALELNEYRESEDIDFICSDIQGYRELRSTIDDRSLGKLIPKLPSGVSLLRQVRADQYGIRTAFGVEGEPVKFEIILEARIQVQSMRLKNIGVPVLDQISCFAEKWLANADRWNDTAVLSRDVIDLAHMLAAWDIENAVAGAKRAMTAYGSAITRAARMASTKLIENAKYRRQCMEDLAITDAKLLTSGLKLFPIVLKALR
ncbi:MAG: nucleotidyl transferase AbiEii/AbiGii toxin family protein [Burkholderiales bacterium]